MVHSDKRTLSIPYNETGSSAMVPPFPQNQNFTAPFLRKELMTEK